MVDKAAKLEGFHQGDTLAALAGLPDDLVDLGVTSPPYNKQEKNRGWLVDKVVYDSHVDALPEAEYQARQVRTLDEIFRVTKPGGSFFYNHKVRWVRGEMLHPLDWLRKTRWHLRQELIWDRTIAGNIRGWRFWQVEERIYWLTKPTDGNLIGQELRSCDAKLTSIWRGPPEGRNPHPAPFPLWLPARAIISIVPEPGGLVLDPYVGSGTTAVAAHLLGHRFIGIDVSADYLQQARARLKNASSEQDALNKELALHTVSQTFADRKRSQLFVGKHMRPPKKQAAPLSLDL